MPLLRRLAPLLSALLVALVAVQSLDLVACADEAEAAESDGGFHVDGIGATGSHPTPVPGADHDDGAPHEEHSGLADCLCHVTFTRTESLPDVASAPAAPPLPYVTYRMHLDSAEVGPLDHVPLA
jgi:hypothetical protein